ncbi:hypothetical protein SUGI_0639120 [Cryptomeria japonica]|nr:hypothetical protein SUGI_0639120 [Cryptomeria japonica]
MKSHLFFRCNGGTAKKICRAQEFDGLLIMVMVVVCLSFLSIFMVPIGLQRKLGLEAAREAMDSVGFAVFVVMDSVSFFSSMAVVMVLLQAIDMHNSSESGMMRMCGIAAQIALGDSCKILHAFPQDMKSRLFFRCNGGTARKICRAQEFDGLLTMVMMVVCLSFLSIFMVPIWLEKKLGLEAAREAMDSVGFAVFVVMDSVSFFSSMAVVMVLLQAIDMHNSSQSGMMRICGIAAQIALGCATIAFVSAGMTFRKLL